MKVARVRRVKKILNFYKNHFGLAPPYRILVDGTLAYRALKAKVNIAEDLPKYLCHAGAKQSSSTQTENHHGESDHVPSSSLPYNCEILTTNCCLKELEDLGPPGHGALCVLRQYTIKPCGHAEPIPPVHCLLSILKGGNPGQFILASMHDELKQKAQNIAQVPILYLNGPAPVLEKPSERAVQLAERSIKNATKEGQDLQVLKEIKREMALKETSKKDAIRRVGRKKKAKGPNPLSMKKKSKKKAG